MRVLGGCSDFAESRKQNLRVTERAINIHGQIAVRAESEFYLAIVKIGIVI
jgi:hypothetical protein